MVANTELDSWQSPIILQGPPDISLFWMNEIYSGIIVAWLIKTQR